MDAHKFGMLKPSIMISTCSFFILLFRNEIKVNTDSSLPFTLMAVTDKEVGSPPYQLQDSEKLALLLAWAAQ